MSGDNTLYWLNVSLLILFVVSFYTLTFEAFALGSLGLLSLLDTLQPYTNAQKILKSTLVYLVYSLGLLLMCNILDHVFHKPITPGVMIVVFAGVVGFQLGRYTSIGLLDLKNQTPLLITVGIEKLK
ncbi:hypothetical protein [Xenorhabdus sp. KJ12.1]|uniref:hypothetical protein n=1 Tax=Xenorhabdus sp. KJ12.1 TaxID=1851571 RepID=UPI000C041573|nr:hypothetical protein [Xenorhabdus sp. KJ12.1]PHM72229.1 hypothetical protein Xekj_00507 [Xenorhabdus sp. KJ12.1]